MAPFLSKMWVEACVLVTINIDARINAKIDESKSRVGKIGGLLKMNTDGFGMVVGRGNVCIGGVVLLFPRSSFRCFCYFGVLVVRCFVVLSFRRSLCRCFCRFVVRRVVLVSFVGILGPTGSHRRANGSFWMPFLTKGDARQDGKPSNKSKK